MSERTLLVADQQAVRVLTLNRPARRNALDAPLLTALKAELVAGAADPAVRAFVLAGAPPAFCSGMDRALLAAEAAASRTAFLGELATVLELIAAGGKPVVAAVNGPAVAGGAALICAADVAIGSREARFGFPGVRQSIVAAVVVPVLLRAVGPRHARHLLLTGRLLDAERCVESGILNEVVDAKECLPRALSIATELAALPPEAVAAAKRYLHEGLNGSLNPTAMHVPKPP